MSVCRSPPLADPPPAKSEYREPTAEEQAEAEQVSAMMGSPAALQGLDQGIDDLDIGGVTTTC